MGKLTDFSPANQFQAIISRQHEELREVDANLDAAYNKIDTLKAKVLDLQTVVATHALWLKELTQEHKAFKKLVLDNIANSPLKMDRE